MVRRPEPDNPHLIYTYTGRLVDPWNLRPEDVDILDITMSLNKVPRFNGHTTFTLSVAEHCVEVALILQDQGHPPEVCMAGLLHDASEAYLCDIPSPVKRQPEMLPYRLAEKRAMCSIFEHFDLDTDMLTSPAIHGADAEAYDRDARRRECRRLPIFPPPQREPFILEFYRYDAERRA